MPKLRTALVLGSQCRAPWLNLAGVIGVITVWTVFSEMGWVNPLLLPSPIQVLGAAHTVGSPLLLHTFATIARIVVGFLLGATSGITLGLVMQYSQRTFALLDGIVETTRPVPPVAVVPFFILVFGFAEIGKLLLVTIGTGLVVTVGTIEAVERIPTSLIKWGLVSGISRTGLFRHIVFRAAISELTATLRIALATTVALVIVAEFMGAQYGLGYLINVAKVTLATPTMFLSIFLLGWITWALDYLLQSLVSRWCAWDLRAQGALL